MKADSPSDPLTDADEVVLAWVRGWAPRPRLTVSEWADRYRYLPDTSAEPGRWRTDRVPYLREPQDCFSATSRVRRVVVKKAAQLGFSEMLNNVIGYSIHQDPCAILMVQPTEQEAEKYSKKRIAPMLESSPVLREIVGSSKQKTTGNTLLNKEFPAGALTLVGSNAPSGLASIAVRRALLDERDRFSRDAGGEGSVDVLVDARQSTFANSQMGEVSTPTIAGDSPISDSYENSDQRVYEVPCPHCGTCQTLEWEQVRWPQGDPASARYHCSACDEAIPESRKPAMLRRGEWVARNPGHPARGYYISGLYSPWVPWTQIAVEFVAAKGDPKRLQAWVNTRLGQTWDPLDAQDIEEGSLVALREPYTDAPRDVVVVTAAVDVQDDRLELELCGWGLGQERWHLDLVVITGDLSTRTPWDDLDRWLLRGVTREDGRHLPVSVTCIDTGGHYATAVYDFCRVRAARRVYAIKGASDPQKTPLWPRRPNTTAKSGGVPVYVLGVSVGKDAVMAAVRSTVERRTAEEPEARGPGMMHWPASASYGRAYFEQLTAEAPVVRYHRGRPQRVWHLRSGRRNEAFDLAVYGLAAIEAWKALGFRLEETAAALSTPRESTPSATARRPETRRPPPRKLPSFFRR